MGRTPEQRHGVMRTPAPDAPLLRLLRRGVFARESCTSPGCAEILTAQCTYVDRRGAACATHWCRRHVQGHQRKAFCPVHLVSVAAQIPIEHRVAIALDWLGRAIDDDIVTMLRGVADKTGENLMSEGVRFATVGLDRLRIWERTWKTYSDGGVGCRVTLGIEDRAPDTVQIRVNSTVVTTMPTPWDAIAGSRPEVYADRLIPPLVVPATIAVEVWLQNAMVQLRGAAFPPR